MEPRSSLEIEALEEIGRILWASTDINKALTSTLSILRLVLDMENGTVSLFDDVTGEVFIEAAPEMPDEERIRGRFRPGEGIIGRVFATGFPAVVPDIAQEPMFLNRTGTWGDPAAGPCAFLGVPILDGRDPIGVLTIARHHRNGLPAFDRDIRFLKMVAQLLAARVRLEALMHAPRDVGADEDDSLPPEPGEAGVLFGAAVAGPRMRRVMEVIQRVARSRATVLLRGETGTGKEVVARALHEASPRAGRAFVAVNCAALNESLLESELFGHEKGAFTGASATKQGRFEAADGGTIFLDEVGELSLSTQVKLLRVLQERQFERVGGRGTLTVDVRIVAATNRNLEDAVHRGVFRLDFYHRLSVVTVQLPPLRDRREEIPALVEHFLGLLSKENGRRVSLAAGALEPIQRCRWSGNVRQLRNCLERAVVTSSKTRLSAADLCPGSDNCLIEKVGVPAEMHGAPPQPRVGRTVREWAGAEQVGPGALAGLDEPARIQSALEQCAFVQAKAARLLGMSERQLSYRVQKYGIEIRRF
jgi:Nif-specific regulatory protein